MSKLESCLGWLMLSIMYFFGGLETHQIPIFWSAFHIADYGIAKLEKLYE